MIKQLLTTQENHYSLTITKLGLRETGLFNVLMGACDGAEVCELAGSYFLYNLSKLYAKNDIALYRDNGVVVFKNKSGPESEKIEKSIQDIFRENELKISIQCNLKIVGYLDVTFNLTDFSYHPFIKTNNEINYIHKQLNHPPSIIKQLPLSHNSAKDKSFGLSHVVKMLPQK